MNQTTNGSEASKSSSRVKYRACPFHISEAAEVCPHCGDPRYAIQNLVKCKDCERRICLTAPTCPYCGVERIKPTVSNEGGFIFGSLGVFVALLATTDSMLTPHSSQRDIDKLFNMTLVAFVVIGIALIILMTISSWSYRNRQLKKLK